MLLLEHEGKEIFKTANINLPKSVLLTKDQPTNLSGLSFPVIIKAQVLHGNRGLHGLIKKIETQDQATKFIDELFAKKDLNNQDINQVLVEEVIDFSNQHYLSLGYDTQTRDLVANYSSQGGEGMDDRGETVSSTILSLDEPLTEFLPQPSLVELINQLRILFIENDATLIEINPLVEINNVWTALDAKVILDDVAKFRHPEWDKFPARSTMGRPFTDRELEAHQVSRSDHRGVAGESFFEFPGGEIGVLAAGGGASILAMDALMANGMKPANYTEHSGNPPREKVKKLTDVILSIPNLQGLFVVGTNANFTDIFETLSGVVDSLLDSNYTNKNFPVLFRRGGPRWQEAFEMINQRLPQGQFKFKTYGPDFPIVATAKAMKELIEEKV